MAFGEVELLFF